MDDCTSLAGPGPGLGRGRRQDRPARANARRARPLLPFGRGAGGDGGRRVTPSSSQRPALGRRTRFGRRSVDELAQPQATAPTDTWHWPGRDGGAAAGRDGLRAGVADARRRRRALAAASQPAGARSRVAGVGRRASRGTRLSPAGRGPSGGRFGHGGHDRLAAAGTACCRPIGPPGRPSSVGPCWPTRSSMPAATTSSPCWSASLACAALLPSAAALADRSAAIWSRSWRPMPRRQAFPAGSGNT